MIIHRHIIGGICIALAIVAPASCYTAPKLFSLTSGVLASGMPDYRLWLHLGTVVTQPPSDAALSDRYRGVRSVYVHESIAQYYAQNGQWPVGSVIVREVSVPEVADTGNGMAYMAHHVLSVQVMHLEASKPDSWRFYEYLPVNGSTTPPVAPPDCIGCHQDSAGPGLVHTSRYPLLQQLRINHEHPQRSASSDD